MEAGSHYMDHMQGVQKRCDEFDRPLQATAGKDMFGRGLSVVAMAASS